MKLTLSFSSPAEIETELLVVAVLDESDKSAKDPKPRIAWTDEAINKAAADLLSSGEVDRKSVV